MEYPLSEIKMEAFIPVTISLTHDIYASLLLQGHLDNYLQETNCPNYPHNDPTPGPPKALELTNSTVDRLAIVIEKDAYNVDTVVEQSIKIALARCPTCKSRFRVLPVDILPYKHFTQPVIELGVRFYNRGDLSLRTVAWDHYYGERTPSHTVLHAWTEGLGAYWSGRCFGEVVYAQPAARIMAELEIHFSQIGSLSSITALVNPLRYRSQGRRERLEACQCFEATCTRIGVSSFHEINRLIVSWGNSSGFCFRSGILCTTSEHINSRDEISFVKPSRKEQMTCLIPGRSPPGDSK